MVGIPDEIKGESPFAFAILKENCAVSEDEVRRALVPHISTSIAKFALPQDIIIVDGLPKTRSGKIMRRILRKIAAATTADIAKIADELGDISTLAEPEVVERIMKKRVERL